MSDLSPGVYERLITRELQRRLAEVDDELQQRGKLKDVDGKDLLVKHVAELTKRALSFVDKNDESFKDQVRIVNKLGAVLAEATDKAVTEDDQLVDAEDPLLSIAREMTPDDKGVFPKRPDIPFSSSALLVNGRDQPQIGREVTKELDSADRVDLLCAFIKWHGLRLIEPHLRAFLERGGQLRVITTTYMGATEVQAIDRLQELGAEISISYDTRRTRLHAKAWLFHRHSGMDTAYVGSSNLSRSAMLDGLEWNVRLARAEQPHLIDTFAATFEEYWNDLSFERYHPERDHDRLRTALSHAGAREDDQVDTVANIDITPFPYQGEILEALEAEREVHGRYRNLVVMATGTGKTIVAALDYARLKKSGKINSLLFVAHRQEIIKQARKRFREVLKDGSFGELLVDENRPQHWQHVFASVQSLKHLKSLPNNHFDMIIVDEFHHAEAPTYAHLLDRVAPKVLLGLTATPERTDEKDILHWFDDGKIAVELRLWEALERGLLSPFHYFGIHDDVDLSDIPWRRGVGYDLESLSEVYVGLDSRVNLIVEALQEKVADISTLKAVGFCVGVNHAKYMAQEFEKRGVPARAVTGQLSTPEREAALRDLRDGRIKAVFTVDLFNEGVDIPAINTILFLRPTESATVFLQQLGRGLRLTEDKPVLTVLDFVGHQRKEFRFDKRFTALTGISRENLKNEIQAEFPTLPAGCSIDLDREVSKIVLDNIKQALKFKLKDAAADLRGMGRVHLAEYLKRTGRELEDLYGPNRGGWTDLLREAGLDDREIPDRDDDQALARAFGRMLHVDDTERLNFIKDVLTSPEPPKQLNNDLHHSRLLAMLHGLINGNQRLSAMEANMARLWTNEARREELLEIADILDERIHRVTTPVDAISHLPLRLHASYNRNEVLRAFGVDYTRSAVEGVRWIENEKSDVFFVTIDKSDRTFKPTTMYHDRAITPHQFQWESQGRTRESSSTGQRYINHVEQGVTVHLFIRPNKAAPAYLYAGPMTYVSHEGELPMRILWNLHHALPADVFHYAKVNAG
ncbi:DUF3427 domain-containing protein [Nocardiopsis suaedae]|uniref:DUF3427 domain-containing protein n=1 Tax=Nocardiopsis suaedae TaxID=3018444 RepID=A0ABT4TEY4_9ACTN|nr:DUF3427 domain-containing protein [Nocardiopsis suaedae]MDA2803161.1 DUF3427 domain-containing protein [Nocardiopsis suaedae]